MTVPLIASDQPWTNLRVASLSSSRLPASRMKEP